jgi:hypothetical protein
MYVKFFRNVVYNTVPVTFSTSVRVYHLQNLCGILLKPVNNLERNSLRMIIRNFFVRYLWHFDHYTLNAYRREEYFSYLCSVSRLCQDDSLFSNIEWLLKNSAKEMWVQRLQIFYSSNTEIIEPFGNNVQTGKTKSKTHFKIKSCTINQLILKLSSLLRHRKVSFLT